MNTPTWEQVKGVGDRLIAMFLTYAVAKGWILPDQAATVGTIVIGLLSLAYGWYVNRPKALLQSAATVPSTVVVAPPELAHDTPEKNIISTTSSVVVTTPECARAIPGENIVSTADVAIVPKG